MDLRHLKLKNKFETYLPYEELEKVYVALVHHLNIKNEQRNKEATQTNKERAVYQMIKKETGLKVLKSIWIGGRSIDLFIPSLCSCSPALGMKSFKGLVIEVDGDVHNQQRKMSRDNSKYKLLHLLDIAVYTIENGDLNSPSFKAFIGQIKKLPRLDSRGRLRLLRRVFIATIIENMDEFPLDPLLTAEQIDLLKEMRGLL